MNDPIPCTSLPVKFTLTITGSAGLEWQGTIQWESGEIRPFCSILELIKEIEVQNEKLEENT